MNCCTAHRAHPVRFLAIVVLSAVAFVGQALGSPSGTGKEPATSIAAAAGVGCTTER